MPLFLAQDQDRETKGQRALGTEETDRQTDRPTDKRHGNPTLERKAGRQAAERRGNGVK